MTQSWRNLLDVVLMIWGFLLGSLLLLDVENEIWGTCGVCEIYYEYLQNFDGKTCREKVL